MKFPSIGACLQWYAVAREGAPRATRLEPLVSSSRRVFGNRLTLIAEIGRALSVLAEIEQAVIHLRHVEGLTVQGIRVALQKQTGRRFLRRTVEEILREGEDVLDDELRRRGLIGGEAED